MAKLTLDDIPLSGKRVLMRVDFNVPVSEKGVIEDDYRIRSALPSITKVLSDGGRLVLMSHLGRPDGHAVPNLSLKPVAERLSELLDQEVKFVPDCIGAEALKASESLQPGEALLLENLRFHNKEVENDSGFARALAVHGELFVNDAFGTAHRSHASTVGVAKILDPAVAGYLMSDEVKYLSDLIAEPKQPTVVILGGAKVTDKIPVIKSLAKVADAFLIGGGMAFTFLKAEGKKIGKSLCDNDMVETCKEILMELRKSGVNYHLPTDCIAVTKVDPSEVGEVCTIDELGDDLIGVDIGPMTVAEFDHVLEGAQTVIWNGPMGIFEVVHWSNGTASVAKQLADLTKSGTTTIVGGGDSAAALKVLGLTEEVTHISTGGGASLELLSGKELPGLEVLQEKN
ncbi:MAG: phosphoglycerate kinase [Candidatus Marinimicrobia bacterium]|nr:phosphoglycerate kinase [Candidatus Neomarinimicrobiota bacterium]